jgi:hypothetical protein
MVFESQASSIGLRVGVVDIIGPLVLLHMRLSKQQNAARAFSMKATYPPFCTTEEFDRLYR